MRMRRLDGRVIASERDKLLVFTTDDTSLISLKSVQGNDTPAEQVNNAIQHLFGNDATLRGLLSRLPANPSKMNARVLANSWNGSKPLISALNMNLTEKCNLACVYCYAKGGNYQRIHEDMTPKAAVASIEEALLNSDPSRVFGIEFFGGEPLLNVAAIRAVLDFQEKSHLWRDRPGGTRNRISTNLTVCDDERIELIRRGQMVVSISLDGTAETQNDQRPFKDGRGSYETIIENIRRLRAACPDLILVARMTAYRHDEQLNAMTREFAASGLFDYVSIYPAAIARQSSSPSHNNADHKHYYESGASHFSAKFREAILGIAADYPNFVGKEGRYKGFLELNRLCADILTGRLALNHCRAGAGYFTLSPDGSVHPCHRLIGDTSCDIGGLHVSSEKTIQDLAKWRTTVDERPVCASCQIRYLCGGGCKQQAHLSTSDMLGNDPNICAWADLLFEAALTICANRNEVIDAKLRRSFAELDRLFVFCGRESVPNNRILTALPDEITVPDVGPCLKNLVLRPAWVTLESV
ncbi:MAG: radical SAM protein [Candidatus Riflebacteria bacterium]|nr:radical SAM protein [Candidatus Riflebacteria bacterium]